MAHILIVDDEPSICWGLSKLVESLGHTASAAASAEQGLLAAEQLAPDAILLDVRLPGIDGLSAIERFQDQSGPVPIIIITAYGDLATAVESVRRGAFEYLVKPFELDVAQRAIERALAVPQHLLPPTGELPSPQSSSQLVGSSPAMQEVFKRIAVVAPTDACVHIRGESGAGKELVARAIHRYSRRCQGPFVAVNVASLSPALAESELFGHVRGAFTGAEQSRAGLLQQADGGTIFFDEVADIPLSVQVKLLRILEHGEIYPVGADRPVRSDFRVISATHQNLHQHVAGGTFRHDLYFRLVTFEVEVPPLRQRREDIEELARHFLNGLCARHGSPLLPLANETIEALKSRPWHGNVRELRNAIEHAIIVARQSAILPQHLPPPAPSGHDSGQTRETMLTAMIRDWVRTELRHEPQCGDLHQRLLRIVERPLLEVVLQQNRGQFLAAARQLGLHRVTLKRKAGQYPELAEH